MTLPKQQTTPISSNVSLLHKLRERYRKNLTNSSTLIMYFLTMSFSFLLAGYWFGSDAPLWYGTGWLVVGIFYLMLVTIGIKILDNRLRIYEPRGEIPTTQKWSSLLLWLGAIELLLVVLFVLYIFPALLALNKAFDSTLINTSLVTPLFVLSIGMSVGQIGYGYYLRKKYKGQLSTDQSSKIVAGLLMALGGLLLFMISYFILYVPIANLKKYQTSSPTSYPQAVITPTPDETANWKTYRNEEYGFEFKYPIDWEIVEGQTSGDYSNIVSLYPKKTPGEIRESSDPEISIGVAYRSLEQERARRESYDIDFNYSTIYVSDRAGYVSSKLQAIEGTGKEILIDAGNNRTLLLSALNANDIFDQILSTFRFVEEE